MKVISIKMVKTIQAILLVIGLFITMSMVMIKAVYAGGGGLLKNVMFSNCCETYSETIEVEEKGEYYFEVTPNKKSREIIITLKVEQNGTEIFNGLTRTNVFTLLIQAEKGDAVTFYTSVSDEKADQEAPVNISFSLKRKEKVNIASDNSFRLGLSPVLFIR